MLNSTKKEGKEKGARVSHLHVTILSLFPAYFSSPLNESLLKRGQSKGLLEVELVDIRDFAPLPHRQVDDRPYGGGPGMVLKGEPVLKAIRSVQRKGSKIIYLTPQGKPLTAERCKELASEKELILLCGHYEGIDERVIEVTVDEEISIGDYVLTNGCLAALVLLDAVSRFIPGVVGKKEAVTRDSFEGNIFSYPQYTRPEVFEGKRVPNVLLSGNHQEIAKWRRKVALEKTKRVRPDLGKSFKKEIDHEQTTDHTTIGKGTDETKSTSFFCRRYGDGSHESH